MALLIDRLEKNLRKLLAKCVEHEMAKDVDVDWAPEKLPQLKAAYSAHFFGKNPSDVESGVYVVRWAHLNKLIWVKNRVSPFLQIYSEYIALVAVLCELDLNTDLVGIKGKGLSLLKQIPKHRFKKIEGLLVVWLESLVSPQE